MSGRGAASIVGSTSRQAELLSRVVVARPPDHDAPFARPRAAAVDLLIGIRPEDGRCPLAELADHVVDTVRTRTTRPIVHRRSRVVGPTVDRELRRGRRGSPRVGTPIVATGGLLPLGLRR